MKGLRHLPSALVLVAAPSLSAAVLVDPSLVAGPSVDLIDPSGAEEIDFSAVGSYSMAALEARSDVSSLQSFAGFSTSSSLATSVSNFVDFTTGTKPDISFVVSSTTLQNGSGAGTADILNTSAGTAFSARTTNNGSTATPAVFTMNITFGTYAGSSLTANMGVDAVGFSLSNVRAGHSVLVEFLGTDGSTVLSSQTATGADETTSATGGIDFYFGYDVSGSATYETAIGSIRLTRTTTASGGSSSGLDDFTFSDGILIPEPSGVLLIGLGSLVGLVRRRR